MTAPDDIPQTAAWRERLRVIIFEADTPAGKAFDVALLVAIVASVGAVLLESVGSIREQHGVTLRAVEWVFTVLFTIEYVLRLACVGRPRKYAVQGVGVTSSLVSRL